MSNLCHNFATKGLLKFFFAFKLSKTGLTSFRQRPDPVKFRRFLELVADTKALNLCKAIVEIAFLLRRRNVTFSGGQALAQSGKGGP